MRASERIHCTGPTGFDDPRRIGNSMPEADGNNRHQSHQQINAKNVDRFTLAA